MSFSGCECFQGADSCGSDRNNSSFTFGYLFCGCGGNFTLFAMHFVIGDCVGLNGAEGVESDMEGDLGEINTVLD